MACKTKNRKSLLQKKFAHPWPIHFLTFGMAIFINCVSELDFFFFLSERT